MSNLHVAKIGGSLLDLPDLVPRFERWRCALSGAMLLLVGGGDAADLVRRFDQQSQLGEERGHWLAVRAMQFNAYVLAAALRCPVARDAPSYTHEPLAVIDPLTWLEEEESRHGESVPHRWTFTSDSIAAHVAAQLGAPHLTLLKSTGEASDLVDADFADAVSRFRGRVTLVNLRADPPASRPWR